MNSRFFFYIFLFQWIFFLDLYFAWGKLLLAYPVYRQVDAGQAFVFQVKGAGYNMLFLIPYNFYLHIYFNYSIVRMFYCSNYHLLTVGFATNPK